MKENKLTYDEALASPCAECKPSICCYFLQVDALTTQKLTDLDKIKFYLNFPNIEICLTEAWEWIVYYNYPCRFYDEKESICRIHDSEQQPGVCVHYNPYNCYYKRMKQTQGSLSQPMIWINRERLDVLTSHISFDDHRIISEIPGIGKLYETGDGASKRQNKISQKIKNNSFSFVFLCVTSWLKKGGKQCQ
jgi:hypothetical protein